MKISILTLFPEMFDSFISTSIIKRAIERNLVEIRCINIRDFSLDKHKSVDDTPFGGGQGMIMQCQPIIDALESIKTKDSHVIFMAPIGSSYNQKKARKLATYKDLILICGHYEGIDARVYKYVDEIISLGDYILTGGEIAAMAISDSIVRLLDGVILEDSNLDESFENNLLEYPQYTKPRDFRGDLVPEVLLSGHHENIRKFRLKESLLLTKKLRPDLFEKYELSKEEIKLLED